MEDAAKEEKVVYIRMDRDSHTAAMNKARQMGVSLNRFCQTAITNAVSGDIDVPDRPIRLWSVTRAKEIIRHAIGVGGGDPGYRNHCCAEVGAEDYQRLKIMEEKGLVREGRKINEGRDQYFHVTLAGCEFAAISRRATVRAMGFKG